MTAALAPVAATLAGLLLQAAPAVAAPSEAASPQARAGDLRLRAHAVDAATLLMLVFGESPRLLVAAHGVGAPLTLDVTRPGQEEMEEEVLRAAGVPFLALGHVVVVGDRERIEAARTSPLRPLLEKGGYSARKVKLGFQEISPASLLSLLAEVGKRRLTLAEGIGGNVVVATGGLPWTEALDALLAAADLTRDVEDEVVRIRRRGDRAPQFKPLEARLREAETDVTPPRRVQSRCGAPQGHHELAAIRLVATLTGGKGSEALLALPGGRSAVIQPGSCIGTGGDRVVRIEPERLVIELRGPEGTASAETVTMEMPRD